jgi:hypothetical protein
MLVFVELLGARERRMREGRSLVTGCLTAFVRDAFDAPCSTKAMTPCPETH